MRVDQEAIRAIADRARKARKTEQPLSLPNIDWRLLNSSQTELMIAILDFLDDKRKSRQSDERPAVYRVTCALEKLPKIISLSEKCQELAELYGVEAEIFREQLRQYHFIVSQRYNAQEYLTAHASVMLCDGYLYSLLGNVINADIPRLWRESMQSNYAAESLSNWVNINLQNASISS
jgi:hypothetical protein